MSVKSKAERELVEFEEVFAAISHETRRLILVILLSRKGEMTAGEIVERFHYKWPTMTRHLHQLETAGLIEVKRVGRERRFILKQEKLNRVVGGWLRWFGKIDQKGETK